MARPFTALAAGEEEPLGPEGLAPMRRPREGPSALFLLLGTHLRYKRILVGRRVAANFLQMRFRGYEALLPFPL